jgi:hypothetical protein
MQVFQHQHFQAVQLEWTHMTWKYTWGRIDSEQHRTCEQPMRQWQNWQRRQKEVGMNYTWTIFFFPEIIWWLHKETDLLLWDCQAKQELHATTPSTKDSKTEKRRHSHKNQGWLDSNAVVGKERHLHVDEHSWCFSRG